MTASLELRTSNPISLNGSVSFLLKVKLKSNVTRPLCIGKPPSMYEATTSSYPIFTFYYPNGLHLDCVSYTVNTCLLNQSNG